MEIPPRASLLRVCVIATLCVALRISAQQQASPPAAAVPQAELQPLIIDDGRHQGEVALTIDLDSNGSVANANASSGGDLVPIAIAGTKIFRYANHGSASGLTQQVLFVRGKDVKSVAPIYPPIAKAAHVTGTVRMVATVAADGHVTDVTVLSGPPMLQGSAKDSLLQWIFPPVQRSGAPSPSHAIVDIHFAQQW